MPEPLRVMHVIDSLAPGGSERVLVDLVGGLWKLGVAVSVCVSRSDVSLASGLPPNVALLVLNRQRTWDWRAILRLVRYCQENQVAILHAHGRSSMFLCAVAKLFCFAQVRLIFHDHYGDIHVDDRVSFSLKWLNRIFVDFYIGVDEVLQTWAIKKLGMKANCTMTLGNAIDLERFGQGGLPAPMLPATPFPLRAVMVANLKPQKDHPLLFQALASTAFARHQLAVLLIGTAVSDNYERECRCMVDELGIGENIFFLGSRNDVPQILQQMDFGLLSSRSESGPLTLLEYMACSLPFLVTDTGQVARKVRESSLSYFVLPGDVQAYAKALDQLVQLSTAVRADMERRGREFVEHEFSLETNVIRLKQIYEAVCQSVVRS